MIDLEAEQVEARRVRDVMVRVLIVGFVMAGTAVVTFALTVTFSVRPTLDSNAQRREQQNLCVSRLQADYDVAVARSVLSPAGSDERAEWTGRLNNVIYRLDHVDSTCFAASTSPPTSGGG